MSNTPVELEGEFTVDALWAEASGIEANRPKAIGSIRPVTNKSDR
jgi:hypothetical protein